MLEAPIPGQSLTSTPKKYPFERTPEINDPEEVIQMYLTKLSEPERLDGIMDMLELDVDVKTLTEGILRNGVANGVHTIDISLIVAPIIHEFIKTSADSAGVTYDEGFVNVKEQEKQQRAIDAAKAQRKLEKEAGNKRETPVEETVSDDYQEPRGSGLMARPTPKTTEMMGK